VDNGDYLSIHEGTGSCWYLLNEIPDIIIKVFLIEQIFNSTKF